MMDLEGEVPSDLERWDLLRVPFRHFGRHFLRADYWFASTGVRHGQWAPIGVPLRRGQQVLHPPGVA